MVHKKEIFFSVKVVIFLYWSFHTILCVSLDLLLKYQELGLWKEETKVSVFSTGRNWWEVGGG